MLFDWISNDIKTKDPELLTDFLKRNREADLLNEAKFLANEQAKQNYAFSDAKAPLLLRELDLTNTGKDLSNIGQGIQNKGYIIDNKGKVLDNEGKVISNAGQRTLNQGYGINNQKSLHDLSIARQFDAPNKTSEIEYRNSLLRQANANADSVNQSTSRESELHKLNVAQINRDLAQSRQNVLSNSGELLKQAEGDIAAQSEILAQTNRYLKNIDPSTPDFTVDDIIAANSLAGSSIDTEKALKMEKLRAQIDNVKAEKDLKELEKKQIAKDAASDEVAKNRSNLSYLGDYKRAVNDVHSAISILNEYPNQTGGLTGAIASKMPDAVFDQYLAHVTSLKDNIALAKLFQLKENSATGASGLGALAVKEYEALRAALGAIAENPGMAVSKKIELLKNVESNLKTGFAMQNGVISGNKGEKYVFDREKLNEFYSDKFQALEGLSPDQRKVFIDTSPEFERNLYNSIYDRTILFSGDE